MCTNVCEVICRYGAYAYGGLSMTSSEIPFDANHPVLTLGPGTPRTRPAGPKDPHVSSAQCWDYCCVPPGLALHSGVGVQLESSCLCVKHFTD